VPNWNASISPDIIDNNVSRERLFYILYGLSFDSSKNDLDFGWDSLESEAIYRSEGNSEPQ